MKVQDVMTDEVQSCGPETNLATVAMQMWRGDFGAMPVVADRKVVGMITDRDICMAAATKHRDPANIRVKEVISGKCTVVRATRTFTRRLKSCSRSKSGDCQLSAPKKGDFRAYCR